MKQMLPVLTFFFGLGCFLSRAQAGNSLSPFDRYLARIPSGHHEAALVRTAARCGISFDVASVRSAVRPEETWKIERSLAHARDQQETDFFATAQVWHSGTVALLEIWNMDSEAGDEIRTLYCLHDRKVVYGEQIEWASGQSQEAAGETHYSDWAYEVRWEVTNGKYFKSLLERFVNEREEPAPKPKLGPNAPKVFGIIPSIRQWEDLKLPDTMLG